MYCLFEMALTSSPPLEPGRSSSVLEPGHYFLAQAPTLMQRIWQGPHPKWEATPSEHGWRILNIMKLMMISPREHGGSSVGVSQQRQRGVGQNVELKQYNGQ